MTDHTKGDKTTQSSKCDYCGEQGGCQLCFKRIQIDVLGFVSLLEEQVAMTDQSDALGINSHLRAVWGVRDALNEYFESGCVRERATR